MFDLEVAKSQVADTYFKLLHSYGKPEALQRFIDYWIHQLTHYSHLDRFIAFEPRVPVLNRLHPHAVGVLLVPFHYTKCSVGNAHVSVIPLLPFSVHLDYKRLFCQEGLDMLHLYLDLTGIQTIGLYQVMDAPKVITQLQASYPHARIYGPPSFRDFMTVCRASTTQSLLRGSKSESRAGSSSGGRL